jgi:hypothetical protein
MSQEQIICLFSLSKKDPTFRNVISINGPINWLKGKKSPPHRFYFRSNAPSSLPVGSKVLFSFESQIFGEAIVRGGVERVSSKDSELPETFSGHYQKFVTLDPDSIMIYRFHPTKRELQETDFFSDYQFSELYTYITREQYEYILKNAQRQPR